MFLILTGLWTQNSSGQCPQPYEMIRTPNYKVFLDTDVDLNFYNYLTNATLKKELVLPNGDLWIVGTFTKICQYDGTSTGITQVLTNLHGIAVRNSTTGIWSTPPLPPMAGTSATNIWYIDGFIYANVNGFRRLETDNSWTQIYANGNPISSFESIRPHTLSNEYIVVHKYNNEVGGLKLWNSQLGSLTPFLYSNNMNAGTSIKYYMSESQSGDTTCVLFGNFPRLVIKGFNTVFDFDSTLYYFYGNPNMLHITNPLAGFGTNPAYPLGYINSLTCINGAIFAKGNNSNLLKGVWMKYNAVQNMWDSLKEVPANWGNLSDDAGWYDSVDKKLYGLGVYDMQTGSFTDIDWNAGYATPLARQGINLYSFGGLLNDIISPIEPNTTTINSVINVIGAQNMAFMASNGHDGDMAKMYEYGLVIDSLAIDNTNCGNFTINHFVDIGTHFYDFTLTDTSGNESSPTTLKVEVSYPTKLDDFDKDFATVFTIGKTISISGDINHILLYDLRGQVIFSKNVTNGTFFESFEYLPSGMYFLKVYSTFNKKQMTKKLSF